MQRMKHGGVVELELDRLNTVNIWSNFVCSRKVGKSSKYVHHAVELAKL